MGGSQSTQKEPVHTYNKHLTLTHPAEKYWAKEPHIPLI